MNDKMNEILAHVAVETFEGLAFMFGFPEDEDAGRSGEAMVVTRVHFRGPFSGRLIMAVSEQVARELTENMLGIEDGEEISSDDQLDALRETINVICGNLLPAIGGKEAVFDIDAPEAISDTKMVETDLRGDPTATSKLSIEDEPCHLFLFLDGDISETLSRL